MSDTTTQGIRIVAAATYEAERSAPRSGEYLFSYRIRIANVGDAPAQLLSRRWVITDERGEVTRVEGPGVVGETPLLAPGEAFEYQSFCPLPTPMGVMEGHYTMLRADTGERFEARIDPFTLAAPGAVN
ncbi:MAG: Co2+/Mg2+ efflux protein ApaG [Thermoanaerobaculia bacterium]|nr:Co2+/Mg2+ efflux protein ApaG [Thermoanaerobaculia bacterium]